METQSLPKLDPNPGTLKMREEKRFAFQYDFSIEIHDFEEILEVEGFCGFSRDTFLVEELIEVSLKRPKRILRK